MTNRMILGLCALVVAWVARGDAVRNAAARAELVKGVVSIDAEGGLPGPFICLTDDAFGVIASRNYDGTIHPMTVGAFYGKGRVVVLGHPKFLCEKQSLRFDAAQYLRNAAEWLKQGKPGKVAVLKNDGLFENLKSCGVEVEKVASLEAAFAYPVIASMGGDMPVADYAKIHDYVAKGGGLLSETLTWGWAYFAERSTGLITPALYFDIEKLFAPFGFVAGDSGVNRTGKGFEVAIPFPFGSTFPEALKAVRTGLMDGNASVRAQVTKTLVQAANACPPGAGKVFDELCELAKEPAAQKRPSPEQPLKAADALARVGTVLRQNAWQQNPVKLWPADPAAAVYPGLPKAGAKVVENEKISVDLSVPRWRSTGLFEAAGAPITVKLAPGAEKLGLKLRVGTTGDDLTTCAEWKRAPLVTVTMPLDKPEMTFSSPFGGLLYVVVPDGQKGTADVTISGAVRAAHFVLGRDTNADWKRMLAECPAPQAEIEGDRYVITLNSDRAAECDDPEWITKFWDTVVTVDTEMTGLAGFRTYKERICADVQLRSGWLHDGYPMMYHTVKGNPEEICIRSVLEKQGNWGVMHELGHNFQNGAWTFDGTGEVTVNLFTLYAMEKAAGLTDLELFKGMTTKADSKRRVSRWVEDGKSFDGWKGDYFLALETFTRIRRVFGWEPFLKMFREYHAPVVGKLPANNQEKIDQWATRLSRILNRNFADYFAAWSWPLSEGVAAECAKYPKFGPKEAEVLYQYLNGVPDDSVVQVTITPKDGAIANVGGWTSFVFAFEPEARERALSNELRVKGTYTLGIEITDETTGKKYAFDYPIRDMNKDMWPVARIATIPYGLTPVADHAYTLKMTVREGKKVRFEGVSEKGAFVSTDNGFLQDGPVNFEPPVKIRTDSPLKGKSILFVGDSITEAICEVYNARTRYTAGWPGRIGWANGMRWINVGISGATVSSIWGTFNTTRNQLEWHKDMPFDILITHGGINDAMGKCPAGTVAPGKAEDYNPAAEDFSTFAGSLEYFFWKAKKEHPAAKIGYIINFKVVKSGWSDWAKMPEYLPLMKAVCRKWGIPYLNLWENESVTAQLRPETRTALGDHLHPNYLGYNILYPYIEQFVEAVDSGAAKPGEEFVPKTVIYDQTKMPGSPSVITSNDVNVAAGKLSRAGNSNNLTDRLTDGNLDSGEGTGNSTTFEMIGKSTGYQEIDLAGLYTIDKLRLYLPVGNGISLWAAYATDDATKPIGEWTLLHHKEDLMVNSEEGYAVQFKPVDAQFVRVYGLHDLGQWGVSFSEIEVYGKLSPRNQIPTVEPDVPTNLVDVAKGKRQVRPSNIWCEDPGTHEISRGLAGDDYIEVDLGAECEIEYLRTFGVDGGLGYWAAYASLDGTKPITEWTKLGGKYAVFPAEKKERTPYTIAFKPTKARYVRVYALRSWKWDVYQLASPEVFGRVLTEETAAPLHVAGSKRMYDADQHWFVCTNAGCTVRLNPGRHVWDGGKVTKPSLNGQRGEITKKCSICQIERVFTDDDPRGVNIALGHPAKFSDGRPANWLTDGWRVFQGWRGGIANAKPLAEIDDEAPCYFEIDLGEMCEISAVNFADDLTNAKKLFAVFVSPDESAPIATWTHSQSIVGTPAMGEGRTVTFEKPVIGRYVRVYGLLWSMDLCEIAVYGKPVNVPTPAPVHAFATNRVFNADQHWFACTNAGCTATRLHENHRFRGMELKALPTATTDGEKYRDCERCTFREITPLPASPLLGEIVSLGKPAKSGVGKAEPRLTDGKFRDGSWTSKEGGAPRMNVDDADKCYFEIDLEKSVPVTALNYITYEGQNVKFAVYGSDDAAKPIAQWKKLGEKTDATNFPKEGWTLFFDGTPARYIRLYGLEYNNPSGIAAFEITVYGRKE